MAKREKVCSFETKLNLPGSFFTSSSVGSIAIYIFILYKGMAEGEKGAMGKND